MEEIHKRIRKQDWIPKIVTPEEAALFFKDGMLVATSGNTLCGYPKAIFTALAERIRKGESLKIDLLSTGPLGPEIEDALAKVGGIRKRIGTVGSKILREAVNRREVIFLEGKSGKVTQYARRGDYGPIDAAVVEAAGIDEKGNLIPATCVYDAPDWVELASSIFIEINLLRPVEMEGMHDIYYPVRNQCIPLMNPMDRIGKPYISLDPKKIRGIVVTQMADREIPPPAETGQNKKIAGNICDFLRKEKSARGQLPPLEIGIGEVMNCFLRSLVETEFHSLQFFLAAATDPLLDLMDAKKIAGISCNSLRFSPPALAKLSSRLQDYRKHMVLRPVNVTNSAEVISRLGLIAVNSALEADLLGQVNSSHLMGTLVVGGIAGSYDYARNSALSIFVLPATSKKGTVSNIVPMVSHVDHTEHEVDVVITEHGFADLRSVEPFARALKIIENCADPCFQTYLKSHVEKAKQKPGRIPAG